MSYIGFLTNKSRHDGHTLHSIELMSCNHRLTRYIPSLLPQTGSSNQLLNSLIITNETSYQTAHPSSESLAEENKRWLCGLRCSNVPTVRGWLAWGLTNRLSIKRSWIVIFCTREPCGTQAGDYKTRSRAQIIMDAIIKAAINVAARRIVTEIVEKTIEPVFTGGNNEQKEEITRAIRNIVQGSLIYIVQQCRLNTIPVSTVDKWAKMTCFMNVLNRWAVGSTSISRQFRHLSGACWQNKGRSPF